MVVAVAGMGLALRPVAARVRMGLALRAALTALKALTCAGARAGRAWGGGSTRPRVGPMAVACA